MPDPELTDPSSIRKEYRRIRRSLSSDEQQQHAIGLLQNVDQFLRFSKKLKIAAYLAAQGEISLDPWLSKNTKHQIFLPMLYEVIAPELRFAEFNTNTSWKNNRFKIIEPDTHWGNTLRPHQLDLMFIPLVAFDRSGNRLGMGGGYYDRTLNFRRSRKSWLKPRLIGIAHSCQEYPVLPKQPWDADLDGIITEDEIITITHP